MHASLEFGNACADAHMNVKTIEFSKLTSSLYTQKGSQKEVIQLLKVINIHTLHFAKC
jgi:hypothetical protein